MTDFSKYESILKKMNDPEFIKISNEISDYINKQTSNMEKECTEYMDTWIKNELKEKNIIIPDDCPVGMIKQYANKYNISIITRNISCANYQYQYDLMINNKLKSTLIVKLEYQNNTIYHSFKTIKNDHY